MCRSDRIPYSEADENVRSMVQSENVRRYWFIPILKIVTYLVLKVGVAGQLRIL